MEHMSQSHWIRHFFMLMARGIWNLYLMNYEREVCGQIICSSHHFPDWTCIILSSLEFHWSSTAFIGIGMSFINKNCGWLWDSIAYINRVYCFPKHYSILIIHKNSSQCKCFWLFDIFNTDLYKQISIVKIISDHPILKDFVDKEVPFVHLNTTL